MLSSQSTDEVVAVVLGKSTHLSCRRALMSTYTVVGSGPDVPCEEEGNHRLRDHVTSTSQTSIIKHDIIFLEL